MARPLTARVSIMTVALTCPYCGPGGENDEGYVDVGNFVEDHRYSLQFTSDSTVQGHRLDGVGTITCESCNRTVKVPKVAFS